jgi:4,5:9,10-diseco-3-hydroxy-5,9,17-trioxoandrosta-1(10),2-diene-4-oate hydrolase
MTAFTRFAVGRMVGFFRAGENGKRWFPRAYRFYYSRVVLPRAPREHVERIVAAGPEMAATLRAAWEGFAEPSADTRTLVVKVECPVFIAWAKSDKIIAWSASKKAARQFKNRTIQLFRGGHAAFLEDPERFAKSLRAFAARVAKA